MEKIIEQHLGDITVDALRKFKEESFSCYASAKNCQLGVSGSGIYIVKVGQDIFKYTSPHAAIDKYAFHLGKKF